MQSYKGDYRECVIDNNLVLKMKRKMVVIFFIKEVKSVSRVFLFFYFNLTDVADNFEYH